MYQELDRQIKVILMTNKKPNYAALAREFGCDYRTVKKHYENGGEIKQTRNKTSKLDPYRELIRAKLAVRSMTVRCVYEFMLEENLYDGTYSNFSKYVKKHGLKRKEKIKGHPRFETLPGIQAQADWKENITLYSRNGEKVTFNVFHLILGYSRLSYIEFSLNKEECDVQRCLMNAFKYFGGVPREILFDNMQTASVRASGTNKRRVNPKLATFAKDFGFTPKLCKVRASYTKGKVESRNKMIDWIRAYDGEFESIEELEAKLNRINIKMNNYECQATNKPPTLLFQKEKEYLLPLPPISIFETYLSKKTVKVGKDSMVYFQGNRYSVDPALIGETVHYEVNDQKLYIYYNSKLNTVHDISINRNTLIYNENHYRKLYQGKVKETNLDGLVEQNLKNFDQLLGD